MKKITAFLFVSLMLILSACGGNSPAPADNEDVSAPEPSQQQPAEVSETAAEVPENSAETVLDETAYIGEYLDFDYGEPNLEIAKSEEGKYVVQIGIPMLTSLDDGVGELTDEGLKFTATDAAGNPISGVITLEGETASVTFTDSTWELLESGSVFNYTKSSDTPNIWSD